MELIGKVSDSDKGGPYQFSRPLNRSDDKRSRKRSQKTILRELKAIYVGNFFQTRLEVELSLDFFETL